jgi:hypothetical protein
MLSISKILRYNNFKINNLVFSSSLLIKVQTLPYIGYNLFKHCSTLEFDKLSRDPNERKKQIDVSAQKKIDIILEDPNFIQKKKIIEMEIISWKDEGLEVPSILRPRDWIDIIKLNSRYQRK